LKGEAYFKVRKHLDRPFAVKMGKNQITVLGTSFNVRAYSDEAMLTATLVEGSVRFEADGQAVTMKPNQQLAFNLSDNRLEIDNVDVATAIAWKDNLLRYKSIPFSEFLAKLQNQYGVKFLLQSKELSSTIVSGSFDNSLSVEQLLDLTGKNVCFNWKKEGDSYIITQKQ
jgi:ferric-dicitrate binding protein FerR (iron transport regulator)